MPTIGETAKGAAPLLAAAEGRQERRQVPCRGCGAPITFIQKPSGQGLMPVDAKETTIAVVGEGGITVLVKGHVPHHIVCPNAGDFRRPRR